MNGSYQKQGVLMPQEAGKFIADNSLHVFIDDDNVKATAGKLAAAFKSGKYSLEGWKKETLHPDVADDSAIEFIFLMDCLNFSFWSDNADEKYTVEYGGKSYTGYWSLVAALRRAIDSGIPVSSAKFMTSVDGEEAKRIFQSSTETPTTVPLLKERVQVMNEAGRVLVEKFNGSFANCVRACGKDALILLDIICKNFSSFRDEAQFEGKTVAFYKRAQILIADIWACFEGKGLGEFHNIGALTMFADYRVPQALEYFGILNYSKALKQTLENLTIMEKGSRHEVEIRGCSIEAVERLKESILADLSSDSNFRNKGKTLVNAITVDFYLWDFAKGHASEMDHLPCHRVRSIFY